MVFKRIIRSFIGLFHKIDDWSAVENNALYEVKAIETDADIDEIHSVWDYLNFKPNTQAFHLASVLGFDEWVDMNEIRRRIKEIFGAEYKNARSLYPYLKTLTDMGLMENSSIGGRMQWRKHDLLLKVGKKGVEKQAEKKAVLVKTSIKKKTNEEDKGEERD